MNLVSQGAIITVSWCRDHRRGSSKRRRGGCRAEKAKDEDNLDPFDDPDPRVLRWFSNGSTGIERQATTRTRAGDRNLDPNPTRPVRVGLDPRVTHGSPDPWPPLNGTGTPYRRTFLCRRISLRKREMGILYAELRASFDGVQ